ncbi:hypothetical protein HK102_002976 [Quaeritorhiza haematococci]|nr:hypothetical protein HK102_002976 [Quaeritorhiza haematococci]
MNDHNLRAELVSQLFVGFEDAAVNINEPDHKHTPGSVDTYQEKLLMHTRVRQDRRKVKDSKPADDEGAGDGKTKTRLICLTVKKNLKLRIHKVKQEKDTFRVAKSWSLAEVESLELISDVQLVLLLDKTYKWTLEDAYKTSEFALAILKLSTKYLKRTPKLINIDEEHLQNGKTRSAQNTDQLQLPRIDLDEVLSDFNWQVGGDAADLEARLLSELQALDAANVHGIIQSEDQAQLVVQQISKAIDELNVIDEWLSHYTQVLDSMGADVHQVELRNKTLQIASQNQKVLLAEVEKLVANMKLPGYVVEILRNETFDPDGIMNCEEATVRLMEVIQTKFDDGLNTMQAVKEKIAEYQGYGNEFAARLSAHLVDYFAKQAQTFIGDEGRISRKGNLKLYGHETMEETLYRFRKLLQWLKDVDARKHHELQMTYMREISRVHRHEIHEFLEHLRQHHMQRKIQADEVDYLFTSIAMSATSAIKGVITTKSQDKSTSSSGSGNLSGRSGGGAKSKLESWRPGSRRKMETTSMTGGGEDYDDEESSNSLPPKAHKRNMSDAEKGGMKTTTLTSSLMSLDVGLDERMMPDEAVNHALTMLVPIMIREQNLLIDIFSLKSGAGTGGGAGMQRSAVTTQAIRQWQDELSKPRELIKDVKVQKRIQELLEGIFSDVREDLFSLIDAGLKHDQSYAVGMMVRLEEFMKDTESTGHTFVNALLGAVQKKLWAVFEKFVEDQQRGIEETKVTSKKRSGILPFFRTFPNFTDKMEKYLEFAPETSSSTSSSSATSTRQVVTKAYERIVKTMFETLDAVAKEVANDPKIAADDKEHVNVHVLTIENMHYFYSEIRARKVPVLDPFVKQSKATYDVNLSAYCRVVVRKPLGKLLEFFEGIEELLKTQAPEEISYHLSYSKSALKEVLKKYPGKEIKKGLEILYRRVDKHFLDEDSGPDAPLNVVAGMAGFSSRIRREGQLLQVVWRGIQEEVVRRLSRFEDLIGKCYPESGLHLEVTIEEVLGYFSELARAH